MAGSFCRHDRRLSRTDGRRKPWFRKALDKPPPGAAPDGRSAGRRRRILVANVIALRFKSLNRGRGRIIYVGWYKGCVRFLDHCAYPTSLQGRIQAPMAERHVRSRLKTKESAMSVGLETSLETLPETSKALKHRREAAACGVFAVNAKSATDRELLLHAAVAAHARTTKTGLMGCPRPTGGMQFACLTRTFPTVTSRAAEHSSAAWRRGATFEALDMDGFDYSAPAELFPTRSRKEAGRWPIGVSSRLRKRSALRSKNCRPRIYSARISKSRKQDLDRDGIRRLYDSEDYPLARRDPPADECAPSTSADEADRSRVR